MATRHNAHTRKHNGNNARWTFEFFFLQIFCKWCGCHFIKRGYESPHMMCLENSNRKFNMSYSKTSWCYPLKPLIKIKSSSQHFQLILRVVLSLTGGGATLNWDRVTHICVNKFTIIGSDNGLSPGRRQAIIWTNDGRLLIGPLGTNFNETSIEIHTFSLKKIHWKISSGKWRPFCLGPNVLTMLYCY